MQIKVDNVLAVRWATFATVTSDDGVDSKYCFLVDQEGPELDNVVGLDGAEVTDEIRDLILQLSIQDHTAGSNEEIR